MNKFFTIFVSFIMAINFLSACQKEIDTKEEPIENVDKPQVETSIEVEENETEELPVKENPPADPRDRISVNLPSDPRNDPNLSGSYKADTGESIYFNHTFKDDKLYLTFLSEDQEPIVEMIQWYNEDNQRMLAFKLGDTEIEFAENEGMQLSSLQEEELKEFGQSIGAEAVANVSAYSYWKMPGRDYNDFRMSFMPIYYYLAPYIAPERKQLTQPPKTTNGTCGLDKLCQLWHNEGMFACGEGSDYLPLLDGPPSECVLLENSKIPR